MLLSRFLWSSFVLYVLNVVVTNIELINVHYDYIIYTIYYIIMVY